MKKLLFPTTVLAVGLSLALPVQAQQNENTLTLPQPDAKILGYEGLVGEEVGLLIIFSEIQDLNERCKNGTIDYEVYLKHMSFERALFLAGSRHLRNQPELISRFKKDFPVYGECSPKIKTPEQAPMPSPTEPADLELVSIVDDIEQGRKEAREADAANNCNIFNRELGEFEKRKAGLENLLSIMSAVDTASVAENDLDSLNEEVSNTEKELELISIKIIDKKRELRECREKNQTEINSSSNVRISGYGRFGLDYNEANSGIAVAGGATRISPPQAGYGVRFLTSTEEFIAKTDSTLTGYTLEARLTPKDQRWSFGIGYDNVEGSSEGQVANGTDGVGIVYNDFAPSGSTGIAIGPRGMDVRTETISERFRINFDAAPETDGGLTFGGRVRLGGGAEFTDTKHKAWVTTPSFTDISSTSEQDLNEAYFFGSLSTAIPLIENTSSISLILLPMLELGYRHAKLSSVQHNICGLCPATDQDFKINIRDDDSGVFYGANIRGEARYKVSKDVNIGIAGSYGYRSHAAEIINTETGDDLFIRNSPTHLDTQSEYRAGIDAFIRASF